MATLWILNLDAEFEMARPRGYQASVEHQRGGKIGQREARKLLGRGDEVVTLDDVRGGRCTGQEIRAWCPTPSVQDACRVGGAVLVRHCAFEVIRLVNDRAFCSSLGRTLPGARYVTPSSSAANEVEDLLMEASGNWLLKRAFGVAGRGQRRIHAGGVRPADMAWIHASLKLGGLQVEPCVAVEAEFSLHGELGTSGPSSLGQPCISELSATGRFVRARIAEPGELQQVERDELLSVGHHVANALKSAGYVGPFGLDAFRWRAVSGELHFHALSEINARFTLGWACGMQALG